MFSKEHPILKLTIDKCVHNILNEVTTDIMYLTGPRVFSQAINEIVYPYVGMNAYYQPDNILNEKLNNICKFYDYDFPGYCNWKHQYADELYKNNLHWSQDRIVF
jgi:hypothetical protein